MLNWFKNFFKHGDVFSITINWTYYRFDIEWSPKRWAVWFYQIYYDGPHYSLWLGPFIFGTGSDNKKGIFAK